MTGAMIKLPEDQGTQGEETFVEIFASFIAAMVCVSCGTITKSGLRHKTKSLLIILGTEVE